MAQFSFKIIALTKATWLFTGNEIKICVKLVFLWAQACLHSEGHMDDGLTLQLCQHEEARAARIIRNTTFLFTNFIK